MFLCTNIENFLYLCSKTNTYEYEKTVADNDDVRTFNCTGAESDYRWNGD